MRRKSSIDEQRDEDAVTPLDVFRNARNGIQVLVPQFYESTNGRKSSRGSRGGSARALAPTVQPVRATKPSDFRALIVDNSAASLVPLIRILSAFKFRVQTVFDLNDASKFTCKDVDLVFVNESVVGYVDGLLHSWLRQRDAPNACVVAAVAHVAEGATGSFLASRFDSTICLKRIEFPINTHEVQTVVRHVAPNLEIEMPAPTGTKASVRGQQRGYRVNRDRVQPAGDNTFHVDTSEFPYPPASPSHNNFFEKRRESLARGGDAGETGDEPPPQRQLQQAQQPQQHEPRRRESRQQPQPSPQQQFGQQFQQLPPMQPGFGGQQFQNSRGQPFQQTITQPQPRYGQSIQSGRPAFPGQPQQANQFRGDNAFTQSQRSQFPNQFASQQQPQPQQRGGPQAPQQPQTSHSQGLRQSARQPARQPARGQAIQPGQQVAWNSRQPGFSTNAESMGSSGPTNTRVYRTTQEFTVLIIDDSPMCAKMARHVLENQLHCSVLVASSGSEGLEMAKQHYDKISLVLLDIAMPDMNGFDVVQALRKVPHLQQLPVLFASGNNDEIDSLCLSLGALGFVLKPVQRHILCQYILAIAPELSAQLLLDQSEGAAEDGAGLPAGPPLQNVATQNGMMQMQMMIDPRVSAQIVNAANEANAQNNSRLGVGIGFGAIVSDDFVGTASGGADGSQIVAERAARGGVANGPRGTNHMGQPGPGNPRKRPLTNRNVQRPAKHRPTAAERSFESMLRTTSADDQPQSPPPFGNRPQPRLSNSRSVKDSHLMGGEGNPFAR